MTGSPEEAVTLTESDEKFLNDHEINRKQLPSPEKIKPMMFPTAGSKYTKKHLNNAVNYRSRLYKALNSESHALQCEQGTPELFKKIVNLLLAEYYDRLIQCETDDQKLGNIVNLCQRLDQVHPFYDGNIRVFAILLLDYLCLQNGFKIPTLLDPNVFDMLSNEELILKIKDGFDRTGRMISSRLSLPAYAKTSGNCKGVEPGRILRSPERSAKLSVTKTPDRKGIGSLPTSTYGAVCTPPRLVCHNGTYLNLPPELNPVNLTAARGQSVLEGNGSEFPPNI
jgi:hypothetical protein